MEGGAHEGIVVHDTEQVVCVPSRLLHLEEKLCVKAFVGTGEEQFCGGKEKRLVLMRMCHVEEADDFAPGGLSAVALAKVFQILFCKHRRE